ncbi:DUF4031 domain-containing protein [Pseudactinotalea sp. HY160]|uniref:DUF4031 domain-containing protein n=1 Tax=Pseudactinotalea sp. HY160 TaxID=2654490 RepID=UPI00128CF1D2|nr:DUF4031 domain-containing protein [Pseudactinotalea sp. HY160]MPV48479.1 DUF4031 domain-containing protein [Pseudactinotalea sp. HY160]
MAILIDPPMWPAHGTSFSHLVSDSSLTELHEFARRAGVPGRAFDEDHYDVPSARYRELIELGARAVDGRELIRALRASGLRVPAHARAGGALPALERRWLDLWPDRPDLGEHLLGRWNEEHRHYHGPAHLLAVLRRLDDLTRRGTPGLQAAGERAPAPSRRVRLAAWFHDAVYDGVPGQDEARSAELARQMLAENVPAGRLARQVADLVLCTTDHRIPAGLEAELRGDAALLIDADLGVLAEPAAGYARYVAAVRADYAHVGEQAWRAGRAAVLDHLLGADPLFRTDWAREHWTQRATENLRRERATFGAD